MKSSCAASSRGRKRMPRRSIAAGILFGLLATLALVPSTGSGQAYPTRVIRLIVDTSPGGITDLLGRLSAEGLARKLGQSVVVENKPGASGNVAIDFVVRSPADGHTLMICAGGNLVVKPFLEHALSFDPMNGLASGRNRRGVHRLRQGKSREGLLRLRGHRQPAPPFGRAVRAPSGREAGARAL